MKAGILLDKRQAPGGDPSPCEMSGPFSHHPHLQRNPLSNPQEDIGILIGAAALVVCIIEAMQLAVWGVSYEDRKLSVTHNIITCERHSFKCVQMATSLRDSQFCNCQSSLE